MQDPFIGTWKLNPANSEFDPNHRPLAGTMVFEQTPEGGYLMTAEGVTAKGEACKEKPATLMPDGKEYPLPGFPGLVTITTRPDANTLAAEVRREDGSVVGGGTYAVSLDGASMTATTFGFDTQLRRFQQKSAWERQQAR